MSNDDETVTINVRGLESLIKAMKGKPPVARVGILGTSNYRKSAGGPGSQTNAEIGAVHEFGTSTVPQRSFLRIPIAEGLDAEMERSALLDESVTKQVIKDGSVIPWLRQVAIAAEACVDDAFETGGNGKWPAWKDSDYSNGGGLLLVDTGQLRRSITSEVK